MAAERCLAQLPELLAGDGSAEFQPSPFFSEQLTAFEIWLQYGSKDKKPPEQLPIVLQARGRRPYLLCTAIGIPFLASHGLVLVLRLHILTRCQTELSAPPRLATRGWLPSLTTSLPSRIPRQTFSPEPAFSPAPSYSLIPLKAWSFSLLGMHLCLCAS